jgi:hypothetical protein
VVVGRRICKLKAGNGVGAKMPKPAAMAWFQAAWRLQMVGWDAAALYDSVPQLPREVGTWE